MVKISRGDARTAVLTVGAALVIDTLGLVDMYGLTGRVPWLREEAPLWWFLALLLVAGVALLLKRANPALALLTGTLLLAADVAIGGSVGMILVMWDLLYTVGLHSPRRTRMVVVAVIAVVTLTVALAIGEATRDLRNVILVALQVGAIGITPLWWATEVREGRELAQAQTARAELLHERAEAISRAAESERLAAVRAERTAMARDLHDVVSSHLSAIAIHSGAALATPSDGERQSHALRLVRGEALASLAEMRTMVELLRSADEREAWTVTAGLEDLPELVRRSRGAGLAVTVDAPQLLGDDGSVTTMVPTAVSQSMLRITQEALTNALRHGSGTATVRLSEAAGALELVVTNPLAPTQPGSIAAQPSAGTGLLSMRERTEAAGGTFEAGPQDSQWRVRARFAQEVDR